VTASRIAVLDFDSTLFDVNSFVTALSQAVEAEFGIDAQAFAAQINQHYVRDETGEGIGYDVQAHLRQHGHDPADQTVQDRLVHRILAIHHLRTGEPDLMFPDARRFVQRLIADPHTKTAILTVNLEFGFWFKQRLCSPQLDAISARVIATNKGLMLAGEWATAITYDHHPYDTALVVDDSPAQIEAVPSRPSIRRVQIVRPGHRYPQTTDPSIEIVRTLDDVQ